MSKASDTAKILVVKGVDQQKALELAKKPIPGDKCKKPGTMGPTYPPTK
jgi:hypothetical protein